MNAVDKGANLIVPAMPKPVSIDEQVAKLKKTLLKDIQRSAYVYRVDCGGCNGCEIEIFSSITPVFDAERFGIKVVASPLHADILLFTGAVTRAMRMPALRAYEAAPDPKIVVSYGACGCGGGIFHDLYCVWGGTDKIVPVDVYIPGCPPTPYATIYGFAVALGLLDQKLKGTHQVQGDDDRVMPVFPNIPLDVRVMIEREARRMAGYWQGRQIAEKFLAMFDLKSPGQASAQLDQYLNEQADPRLSEIVMRLLELTKAALA